MRFNVTVPVKPYVKRFLENNYGDPVDFRNHPRENEMFRRMLKKPCHEMDHMYNSEMCKQAATVEMIISERDFYRYGWELSKTDIISFGKYFEKNAKFLMRSIIGIYINFGIPLNSAIAKFQERFHMEEDYWPAESISKDFFRFRTINNIQFNHFQQFEVFVLNNLIKTGSITNQTLKRHEKYLEGSQ